MKNELIDLNILPIETLAEMANEKAELVEKNARKTVSDAIDCGRYLTAIKDQIEHGKWAAWLGVNWNYSQQTAMRYMQISNSTCVLNLKEAKSINEALRMISDDREEKSVATRAERIPNRVEVSIPDETFEESPCAEAISTCGRGDERENEEVDDDPTPDPPTIRKTAKGSEKVGEDKKPPTQPIVPEIVEDDETESGPTDAVTAYLDVVSPVQVVRDVLTRITDDSLRVKETRRIRKELDKFDPPTKFTRPDLEEVSAYFAELKASGPESFFDFYESKGWLVGKVSMKDWRASARKWVRENESNPFGGTGNGNGKRTAANADPESCLGPNGRPKIERAKIVYK